MQTPTAALFARIGIDIRRCKASGLARLVWSDSESKALAGGCDDPELFKARVLAEARNTLATRLCFTEWTKTEIQRAREWFAARGL